MLSVQNRNVIFHHPRKLVFGAGSLKQMTEDFLSTGLKRLFILTISSVKDLLNPSFDRLEQAGVICHINTFVKGEPSFADFEEVLSEAKEFKADCIAGIGGGSVMDMAKLIAAQLHNTQPVKTIIGNGLLKERSTFLICMPTTSGTGSEVSPNAIFTDELDGMKKGVISPFLVPDGAYIDPELTLGLPAAATAYTGFDALTHCIEAYTNRFAHPMTDVMALEGIRLISRDIKKVVMNGADLDARSNVALGSVYGGMCLGPVNTAAVHALAYPLGSDYKIAHGLSNAVLLPYVMEFNLSVAVTRYANIAIAMGAPEGKTELETAMNGISFLRQLISDCDVPSRLSVLGISRSDIGQLANSAMQVQRLLKNNIREVALEDAIQLYETAY